jgi:hypothetical protein
MEVCPPMKSRFALAAAAMTCLLACAAIIGIMQQKEAVNQIVDVYLGNTRLAIPSPYFRFDHAKLGGRLPEIDLAADSKTFRPVILKGQRDPWSRRTDDQIVRPFSGSRCLEPPRRIDHAPVSGWQPLSERGSLYGTARRPPVFGAVSKTTPATGRIAGQLPG